MNPIQEVITYNDISSAVLNNNKQPGILYLLGE